VCASIGDPIRHSLSPRIHNAAYEALGLNFAYAAFGVTDVPRAIDGIRGLGIRGVNVTMPHKQAVIPFLDELEERARAIGAVNTIVNDEGRLKGYNTDAPGFMAALKQTLNIAQGRRAIVLGAGGAARAIVYELVQAGARVTIFNRTLERAEELAKSFGASVSTWDELEQHAAETDIVVNATSIGFGGDNDEPPVPVPVLRKETVVCDVVYLVRGTQLIIDAKAHGCAVVPGTEMFLHQAAFAFKQFTGYDAPIEVMRKALEL